MLSATLIEPCSNKQEIIIENIEKYCPYIYIRNKLKSLSENCIENALRYSDMCFVSSEFRSNIKKRRGSFAARHSCVFIYLENSIDTSNELGLEVKNDLPFPFNTLEFLVVMNSALKHLLETKSDPTIEHTAIHKNIHLVQKSIGIPNIDGIDFVPIANIIRCEGMQKCTKVIVEHLPTLVSSYSIGQFCKILEPVGFLYTHRSHLINPNKIRSYHREGVISLNDGSSVPLSRRRKEAFLQSIISIS